MSEVRPPAAVSESAFRAFVGGLREPSALALVIALVTAAALLLSVPLVVDEDFMMSPDGRVFATQSNDKSVPITATLLRFARALPPEPQVYLFGASTVRSSVDPEQLETELLAASGHAVRAVSMTSGGQRPMEALALIDALPAGARGVVVVGVGVPSLMYSEKYARSLVEAPRVAIRLPTLDAEAARLGVPTPSTCGNYFWDNRRYFLPRIPTAVSNALFGMKPLKPMNFLGRALPGAAQLENGFRMKWRGFDGPDGVDSTRAASLEILDRLASAVAARGGMRLVLLEDTIHPSYATRPRFVRAVESSREVYRDFAARRGVLFVGLQERARLGVEDFADTTHVRSRQGVARFTHELAIDLAPLVREIETTGR